MSTMKDHRIVLLVGKRGTGKSTLLEDVLYQLNGKYDMGIAVTPTEESAKMFRKHMPEQWIYNAFNVSTLESVIAIQKQQCRVYKQKNLFLALDDCLYDKKVLRSTAIREIFMNGRHLKLAVFLACQYIMDMGPDLRTNVDYVFALRENIISNRMRLWKYFYGMFEKFDDFAKVMDACTNDYCCLVLDNTSRTNKIEDAIFWYRADNALPEFEMGNVLYRQLASKFERRDDCEDSSTGSKRVEVVERVD